MTQKTALIISALLTAFVLVIGGGLVARISQPVVAPVEAAPAQTQPTATTPSLTQADVNAQVEQLVQQREEQYRLLIEEANRRLEQANQQAAAAVPVVHPAQAAAQTAPAASDAQPTASLSAESARNIAIDAAHGATMIRQPELVLFEGHVAYEVGFTRGVVYVDATNGAVLFNGAQNSKGSGHISTGTQPQPQPSNGEQEHEHEDDHGDD